MPDFGLFALVLAAGVVVGLGELLSRHRDYPVYAIMSLPSFFYLVLNGVLSVLALLVVKLAPPEWLMHGTGPDATLDTLKTALLVGFGAAAFFRSSFFKLRTAEGDISVGPGLIIDVFLKVIDDAVDRKLGERRLTEVSQIMRGVSFTKSMTELPTLAFASLRRLSAEDQQQVALGVQALNEATGMTDQTKAVSLGLSLMTLTGRPILQRAVTLLGEGIQVAPALGVLPPMPAGVTTPAPAPATTAAPTTTASPATTAAPATTTAGPTTPAP